MPAEILTIDGFALGTGTSYRVMRFNPWGTATRSDQSGARPWTHGSWSGLEVADQSVVPIQVMTESTDIDTWQIEHLALKAAMRPRSADVEMRWQIGATEYMMFGRPRMVEPDDSMIALGRSLTRLAFVGLDPRIYSGTLHTTGAIGPPVFTGGLTVPVTVPVTISSTMSSGSASLVNAGSTEAPLSLRIDGPVVSPRLDLARADGVTQTLQFDLTLGSGQWLEIDTLARTVYLNGSVGSSMRGFTSGDFPLLPTGTSTLYYKADTGTLTATWRDAWL